MQVKQSRGGKKGGRAKIIRGHELHEKQLAADDGLRDVEYDAECGGKGQGAGDVPRQGDLPSFL